MGDPAARAFLRYIQADNHCERTGRVCRNPGQCGCYRELEVAIDAEHGSKMAVVRDHKAWDVVQ